MDRILVVEEDPLLHKLLSVLLEQEGYTLSSCSAEEEADMLLVGISSHRELGLLRRTFPRAKLLLFSRFPAPSCLRLAHKLEADGFCYLNSEAQGFFEILRRVRMGERVFPAGAPACMLGNALSTDLTQREFSVLEHLAQGETDAAIAEKLFISVRTVKSHIQSMREKTGLRNRTELAVQAGLSGLVMPNI